MAITKVQTTELEQSITPSILEAQALEVVDQASLEDGVSLVQTCKSLTKQIDETFDPHIHAAHVQHKALLSTKKQFLVPLENAEALTKQKIKDYAANNEAKAKGLSVSSQPDFEVVDMTALIKAVAKGTVPPGVLKTDSKAIRDLLKAGFKLPGVEATEKKVISIRA